MANSDKIEDRPTWNDLKTPKLMERMLNLYETRKWHDCVFKLWKSDGTGEELVFAHNLVLASSSPVFEALCFGPLAEENAIEVPDIDPMAFKMMLKFIYTDCIEFTSVEMACNVLYASKKYLIHSLSGLSISFILCHINESNCLQVYTFASFIQEDQLIKESWKYLCSHLDIVSNYLSYESITSDLVKNLVNEEALNGDELILFKICLMWAESECDNNNLERNSENLRKILIQADLLNKIRWLTMSLKDFEDGPQKTGILTNEEIQFITDSIKLMNHICFDCENQNDVKITCKVAKLNCKTNSDVEKLKSKLLEKRVFPFSVSSNFEPRKKIELKKLYCHRFIEKEERHPLDVQNNLRINTYVVANKSVRLTAIFLNAQAISFAEFLSEFSHIYTIERNYNEKLFVTVCDNNNKILFSTNFSKKVSYGTEFKITLPYPVLLERSKEYNIQIDLFNSPENYTLCVRNSVLKFPSGLCVTFREQAHTCVNGSCVDVKSFSIVSGIELCL